MPNSLVPAAGEAMPAVRLSDLFADPFLRRAFRRAERDASLVCAIPSHLPSRIMSTALYPFLSPAEGRLIVDDGRDVLNRATGVARERAELVNGP